MRKWFLVLAGATTLALGGCGDTRVTLQLQGISPLNVNEAHETTSVNVRFYQLKDDARFRSATVDSLWTDDKKVLDGDLLGEPQITTVLPGSASDAPTKLTISGIADGTRFIGVLALYNKSDAHDNRTLVLPLATAGDKPLVFTGFSVSVQTDKPADPPADRPQNSTNGK